MNFLWNIVQKIVKAVSKENDTERERHNPQPVLRTELQIPHAVIERYEAHQHDNAIREQKRARVDCWRLVVEFLTLVFAIGAFGLVYKTWKETKEANRISREALISVQGARINLK